MPPKNGSNNEVTDYGNITVTAKELADVLGLSEQNVYNLRRRNRNDIANNFLRLGPTETRFF